ncbi:hypothetical protein [Streptomyces sp. NBC_01268]|uniref:hypothetical protein n=1 Tax=Streptomyces sp. NBC_01268 TaxID=2903806 RepID=UPI002E34D669|nr:hypothetical protein [Streptomyces sp. NBC_01268]
MTDISTEPVVGVTAPAPPPPPAAEQPVKETPKVEHTPGGWPVVPLATTSANSTISGIAAAALAAGPAGAAVAATGAALIGGAILARRAVRNRTAKTTTRAAKKVPTPRQSGSGSNRSAGGRGSGTGARRAGGTRSGSGASRTSTGRTGSGTSGSSSARSPKSPGRVGQVKALRQDARSTAAGRTRAERRTQGVQDRRQVAGTRRNTPSPRPSATTNSKHGGGANSSHTKRSSALGGRVRAGRDAAVQRARNLRDRSAARAVDGARDKVQAGLTARQARVLKRAVRRDARRQLWKSAARKQGRRLLAALLAAPVGALGMLTTPLGRKLGIKSIQHPGRRLYRRLMRTAEEQQAARDAEIRERQAAAEAAIDADLSPEQQIGDKAERPTFLTPAAPSSPMEVPNVSGFKFEEAAAEMENAARTYEPETAMEILSMVENLPDALTSVANTFKVLAERSDGEFPLEKQIAAAFDEIYGALMRAVDSSGEVGPLFRQVHEKDIARHEDPRNGVEAEKGWNV